MKEYIKNILRKPHDNAITRVTAVGRLEMEVLQRSENRSHVRYWVRSNCLLKSD